MKRKFLLVALFTVFIAAMALLAGCGDVSSLLGGGSSQLSTPTNISYDGTTITWDSVENAQKYSVTISGEEAKAVYTASRSYSNSDNTQFTVTIIAMADDYDDSESASHTFIPMASVADITVSDDGIVSWTAVDDASGYQVEVDGEVESVTTTRYTTLTAGTHSVRVKPYTELINSSSDTSYYAKWSSAKTITICEDVDVDNIKYSAVTGKLTWTGVSYATSYLVTIQGDSATVEDTVSATSYSYDAEHGSFTVFVKALGNHSTSYDSKSAVSKKFVYLETATNLRVTDGVLYWDEVSGATGYYIQINGTTQSSVITQCQYSGFTTNLSYTVKIIPTCDDTIYFSSWTSEYVFSILKNPELTWNDIGLDGNSAATITWDGIDNAVGYAILITYPSGEQETISYGETTRSFSYDYSETGTYTVAIKSTGSETGTVKDSSYSSPITITRLAAPQFIEDNSITSNPNDLDDGYTITFKSVQKATGYQIYLNDNAWTNITNTQYTGLSSDLTTAGAMEGGTFTIKIQSLGSSYNSATKSVVLSSLSAKSLECTITVLSTPVLADEPISGYSYSYSSISGAYGYCVSINGSANVWENLSYDLSGLSEGSNTVKVCARGNGSNVLASNYTASTTVIRLSAPTDVYVRTEESEGTLNFTEVQYAKSYLGVIDATQQSFPINSSTDIASYITTTGTTMYFQTEANYFDNGTYYMTSPSGSTYTFVKLSAPSTLTFTGSQFIWNAPANSGSYNPTYVVYNGQGETQRSTTTTSIDTSWLTGGTAYTLTVKAIGSQSYYNGVQYINSDISDAKQAYKLSQPTVKISNNAYSWYAVDSAVSYTVYVDGDLVYTGYNQAGTTFTYTPSFNLIKTYTLQFYAIGGEGESVTYIDSEATVIEQVTKQLSTPTFALSYSESTVSTTGEIIATITTESPYATGYYYSFGGATEKLSGTTYSMNPNTTSGSVAVRVYAAGGGFDESGIYYINSQSTEKTIVLLGTPSEDTISVDTYGRITWGSVANASAYTITLEFTTSSGSYTVTIENLKSASFSWTDYIYNADSSESYSGINYTDVSYLKVTISATAASATYYVPSATVSRIWTNLH